MNEEVLLQEDGKGDGTTVPPKKLFHQIGISLFIMGLVIIVVQTVAFSIVEWLKPELKNQAWLSWGSVFLGFHAIGFPVYLFLMKKIPDGIGKSSESQGVSFGPGQIIKYVIICLSTTYLFNYVSLAINYVIGLIKGSQVINPIESVVSTSSVIFTILVGCIFAPVIEEIVFRGILINKLRDYDDKTIIWFSGIVFGLFHMNLSQFFYATALGMIFAYIALKTKSIKHVIILHIIVNLFGTVIFPGLVATGNLGLVTMAGLLVIMILIAGIVLAVKEKKRIVLEEGMVTLPKEGNKRIKYGNVGMILYIVLCLVMFVMVILG